MFAPEKPIPKITMGNVINQKIYSRINFLLLTTYFPFLHMQKILQI